MSTCIYTFKTGKRKNLPCGVSCDDDTDFCSKHKPKPQAVLFDQNTTIAYDKALSSDTLENLYLKFSMLRMSPENHSIISKKFKYITSLKPATSEYIKNLTWLRHALQFPYDKSVELPVSCPPMNLDITHSALVRDMVPNSSTANYIAQVYQKLDDYVYGMNRVKEQVLSFVCKRVANPESTNHVLALQGGYGVGKCFAHGTLIMLHDGTLQQVQNVKPGDIVMGDDEMPRHVYGTGTGVSTMYEIQHTKYPHMNYTVNEDHILVLKDATDDTVYEMTVKQYLCLKREQQCNLQGFAHVLRKGRKVPHSVLVKQDRPSLDMLQWDVLSRQSWLKMNQDRKFEDENEVLQILRSSVGDNALTSPINVVDKGMGQYYGFTIDGNERFLLGNCVVTHNTRLAKGLSQALNLPLRTINLGSVNDVSYFTGHGFTYVESEPGRIVQILNETQCKNCIIYFDELDKIHQTEKAQAIHGFLTHLIDPSQSKAYQDMYLSGLELDLSQVFFVFSFNDPQLVDKTVLDRLKVIHVPDPSMKDKIAISEKFIIPEIARNINLEINIDPELVERIVVSQRDAQGLRTIKRAFEEIINNVNVLRMMRHEERKKLTYYSDSYSGVIENTLRDINNDTSPRSSKDILHSMYS